MKTVIQKNALGIVLDSTLLDSTEGPLKAHLVLNHRLQDENGYSRVTPTAGFLEILDIIDSLKAELDCLANETILWLAQSIASRRTRFGVISSRTGGVHCGGEDNMEIVPPSHASTTLALPKIHSGPWPDASSRAHGWEDSQ